MQPYLKDRSTTATFRGTQIGTGMFAPFGSHGKSFAMRRRLSGFTNPKWRQQIQDGLNATTSMTADYMSAESRPTWCSLSRAPGCGGNPASGTTTYRGDLAFVDAGMDLDPDNPGYSPLLTSADNKALAELYSRVHDIQTAFQGLTFLGELRESLRMLRKPANAIADGARGYVEGLKKLKKRDPRHWLKSASGLWLEHSFGWVPLLADCKNAAKAHDQLVEKPKVKRFKASGVASKIGDSAVFSDRNPTPAGVLWYDIRTTRTDFRRVIYRGAYRFQAETTLWQDAALFGFQPKEFIPTAWELMPWSFLIDYFSNVGDILEASITSTAGVSHLTKTVVQTGRIFRHARWDHVKMKNQFACPSYIHVQDGGSGWGYNSAKRIVRTQSTMPEVPTLEFKLPGSDGQLLNIAALFAQCIGIHPQRRFNRRGVPYDI